MLTQLLNHHWDPAENHHCTEQEVIQIFLGFEIAENQKVCQFRELVKQTERVSYDFDQQILQILNFAYHAYLKKKFDIKIKENLNNHQLDISTMGKRNSKTS